MRRTDIFLLILLMLLLCGWDAVRGRPLTLHEARLPQTSREMMAGGNWLIPTSGGRPWLECPPLPHWIMIATAYATGTACDREWSVRIAPGIMALIVVLLGAVPAQWFGRGIGVATGCVLATMFEFYRYATLAEDDIFLAAIVILTMAMFIQTEFVVDPEMHDRRISPFGARPWRVVVFFVLLGLTNLAKGPLVGDGVILGTLGVYLLLQRDWRRIRRYLWIWGFLAAAVLGAAWHVWIQHRFPEYLKNLRFDLNDTENFDQPIWYYPIALLGLTLPWSPLAIVGLFLTARSAWCEKKPAARFLWCWAIVPMVVLSLAHRKHHHYLVPSLAPWAILAAIGARGVALHMFKGTEWLRKPRFGLLAFGLPGTIALIFLIAYHIIPGPAAVSVILIVTWLACVWMFYHGLIGQKPAWLLASVVLGVGLVYSWGQKYWPNPDVADTQFLRQVDSQIPSNDLLAVDASIGPLNFFRVQFYLRPGALLLHNLSYLRSDKIHSPQVDLITWDENLPALSEFGSAQKVMQSARLLARKDQTSVRLTLFHLEFKPNLQRYPPPPVSPMQAMQREPGPICGPP